MASLRQRQRAAQLTGRQLQLLVLLANGRTVRQAAAEMSIAPQTAKNLATGAYHVLQVPNRYAAFLELGWLTPPAAHRG